MRKVKGTYSIYVRTETKTGWESVKFDLGYFHQWGSECEEFEDGGVQVTIAIVELPDGQIVTVAPRCLQFIKEDNNDEQRLQIIPER